jgi:23S rRNA pseudouridine1911/1915/1917 synthase
MIAKNDTMMKYLAKRIEERKVEKYYIAIVAGVLPEKEFKVESFIGRHPTDKIRMTTQNPLNPKIALTSGEVLGYIDELYSVVKIKLETGRTHQIRVHMASIGYPIIGDSVYGDEEVNKKVKKLY